jgi:MFS family permease
VRGRGHGTLPLYVGGFLGPFGGGVLAVLVPQLRDAFAASTATVAAGIPVYFVPFAALQLVSGTLGERFGRRRVVRSGYLAYAAFSLLAGVAPGAGVFLVARALQGAANAFLSPLLLAGLADEVPPAQIGRAVGTFAAVQTAAVALSPLCGGALGAIDWRLAFLVPAAVAVGLAFLPPADAGPRETLPRLRAVMTRRVGLLSAAGFAGYAGVTGVSFLVAIFAADVFGLPSLTRGFLLAGFGVSGMLVGRPSGNAVDRYGRVPVALVGSAACTVLVGALGFSSTAAVLAALWFVAGIGSALIWAGINTLAVEAVPGNRAGGTSVVSAFKFAGTAAAPLMWLPLYHVDPRLGFLGAAAVAALTGAFVIPLRVTR